VLDYNTPYAPGSLPAAAVTVEAGSLYTVDANHAADPNLGYNMIPGPNGVLLKLTVSGVCDDITVAASAAAGGVVSEGGNPVDVNDQMDCFVSGPEICLPDTPDYAIQRAEMQLYHDAGYYLIGSAELDSWCTNIYQCDGDASGTTEGWQKYRVMSQDLTILAANWKCKLAPYSSGGINYPAADPRADFNHQNEGWQKYRVMSQDLTRLANHWKYYDDKAPMMPGDCPRVDSLR